MRRTSLRVTSTPPPLLLLLLLCLLPFQCPAALDRQRQQQDLSSASGSTTRGVLKNIAAIPHIIYLNHHHHHHQRHNNVTSALTYLGLCPERCTSLPALVPERDGGRVTHSQDGTSATLSFPQQGISVTYWADVMAGGGGSSHGDGHQQQQQQRTNHQAINNGYFDSSPGTTTREAARALNHLRAIHHAYHHLGLDMVMIIDDDDGGSGPPLVLTQRLVEWEEWLPWLLTSLNSNNNNKSSGGGGGSEWWWGVVQLRYSFDVLRTRMRMWSSSSLLPPHHHHHQGACAVVRRDGCGVAMLSKDSMSAYLVSRRGMQEVVDRYYYTPPPHGDDEHHHHHHGAIDPSTPPMVIIDTRAHVSLLTADKAVLDAVSSPWLSTYPFFYHRALSVDHSRRRDLTSWRPERPGSTLALLDHALHTLHDMHPPPSSPSPPPPLQHHRHYHRLWLSLGPHLVALPSAPPQTADEVLPLVGNITDVLADIIGAKDRPAHVVDAAASALHTALGQYLRRCPSGGTAARPAYIGGDARLSPRQEDEEGEQAAKEGELGGIRVVMLLGSQVVGMDVEGPHSAFNPHMLAWLDAYDATSSVSVALRAQSNIEPVLSHLSSLHLHHFEAQERAEHDMKASLLPSPPPPPPLSLSSSPTLAAFWHIGAIGPFWTDTVLSQYNRLQSSSLLPSLDALHAFILGSTSPSSLFPAPLPPNLHIHHHHHASSSSPSLSSLYEYPTLLGLSTYCQHAHPASSVLYFHTKCTSIPLTRPALHLPCQDWRAYMEHFVLDHHRACLEAIHQQGYDTCGVELDFLKDKNNNAGIPPSPRRLYYAGNMWWATCRYINTLPSIFYDPPTLSRRHVAELWIGMGTKGWRPATCFQSNASSLYEAPPLPGEYADDDKGGVTCGDPPQHLLPGAAQGGQGHDAAGAVKVE